MLSERKRAPALVPRQPSARVLQALDSMTVLSEFARNYERGARIPPSIWAHAKIMGEYFGYPPAKTWLPQFLNRPFRR